MTKDNFIHYENFGISIDIPSHLQVKMENGGIFAASEDERSSITMEVNPHESIWKASEEMIRQPLGIDPFMRIESRILREGPISTPYPGYERVIEHFMKATGETDFGWLINYSQGSMRIILEVGDFCTFAEKEEMWSKVVQSLHINGE